MNNVILQAQETFKGEKIFADWFDGFLYITKNGGKIITKLECPKPVSGHYSETGELLAIGENIDYMNDGKRFITIKKEIDGNIGIVFHNNQ